MRPVIPEVLDNCNKIRNNLEDKKIIFSVTDWTTPRVDASSQCFEYFLERYPEWREKVFSS